MTLYLKDDPNSQTVNFMWCLNLERSHLASVSTVPWKANEMHRVKRHHCSFALFVSRICPGHWLMSIRHSHLVPRLYGQCLGSTTLASKSHIPASGLVFTVSLFGGATHSTLLNFMIPDMGPIQTLQKFGCISGLEKTQRTLRIKHGNYGRCQEDDRTNTEEGMKILKAHHGFPCSQL